MSRRIILDLAAGEIDSRSPEFKDFLMELCTFVASYKEEWFEIMGGDGNWRTQAALHMLGVMYQGGPNGGKPPIEAIVGRMNCFERELGAQKTDQDWRKYFFDVFKKEQRKHIESELGSGADGELRIRLKKAFTKAGVSSADKEHYGLPSAFKHDMDVHKATKYLNQRAPSGSSSVHEAVLPTVADLAEMIKNLLDEYPQDAPRFGVWIAISKSVFRMVVGAPTVPWDAEEGTEGGFAIRNSPATSPDGRGFVMSHADVAHAKSFVVETICKLDGLPFPTGQYAKTFVEFLLWMDNEGPLRLRVTQESYAVRVGVTDGTISNYKREIFIALRRAGLADLDPDAVIVAFQQLQEQYLEQHLEIFPRSPLEGSHEPPNDLMPS